MDYFEIHIVEHCNLNCQCCDNYSPLAEESFVKEEDFEKEMKQLSSLFPNMRFIRLLGGEPLLHPNICFFIETSRKYFPFSEILITTNAILLGKMDKTFWEACHNNNVGIEYTFYPINLNYSLYEDLAKEYGVVFVPFANEKNSKLTYMNPVSFEKKYDKYETYFKCYRKYCVTLKDGKIYHCTCVPNICHFNKYFNKNLEVTESDYIDIYTHTAEEIDDFLNNPIPFCSYCDYNNSTSNTGKFLEWKQTKYDIKEWTFDED